MNHFSSMRRWFALFVCAISVSLAHASNWIVSIDERSGLPTLSVGGTSAITPDWVFWGANWSWADTQIGFKLMEPYRYAVTGSNRTLGFDLKADVRKDSDRKLVWTFRLDASKAEQSVIGGGMVFRFDLENFAREMGEPVILPNNQGWAWGKDASRRLELRFEPALKTVYFERGNKSELRAFFYKDVIKAGAQDYTATLTLSGDVGIGPTVGERFGLSDATNWPLDNLDWKTAPVKLVISE